MNQLKFLNLFLIFSVCLFHLVHSQSYFFTEEQKNAILQQHKQRLQDEAMKMFENQFQLPIDPSSPNYNQHTNVQMFNQMLNYHGLYENLHIRNLSTLVMTDYCHEILKGKKILGFDYKRHRNLHHLVCFTQDSFLVRTFHLDNYFRMLVFDDDVVRHTPEVKNVQGTLVQMKFYRQYETDQLFIAALLLKGVHQIRIYEIVVDGPQKIIDKELLHTFQIQESVRQIDVLYFDLNKIRLVALIDSGWRPITEDGFLVETSASTNLVDSIIKIRIQKPLRLRTLRIQSQGFLVVANTTHWAVYRYQDRNVEQVNLFQMKYFIRDLQLFNNGHRYYVAVVTHQEQYIYQWKDGKHGFQGVARIRQPLVYKMNSITISYSRVDNFFYFDQLQSNTISIYGYDITNSVFVLLRTFPKSHLNIPLFDSFYSVNFYDHNFAYQLKLTSTNQIYLLVFETVISNSIVDDGQDSVKSTTRSITLYNLQRYNKQIYEQKIAQLTKNVYKLDQQETISKYATNLTFNFNVTFKGKVNVNRYRTSDPRTQEESYKIRINQRDYAFHELRLSMDMVNRQIGQVSSRMYRLNQRLNEDVVYRNQNVKIDGMKRFINRISLKKIYAQHAQIHNYHGQNVDEIFSNIYWVSGEQSSKITGRKTFLVDLDVQKQMSVQRVNGMDLSDFLYTDLNQDIYSNFWYRRPFHSERVTFKNDLISSNISLANAVFINQRNDSIRVRNKLVFDHIEVDNLYTNMIDKIPVDRLPEQVLTRRLTKQRQVIRVPTQIDNLQTRSDLVVQTLNGHNVTRTFENLIHTKKNYEFEMPVYFHSDVRMNHVNLNGTVNDVRIPEDLVDRHSKQDIYGVKRFRSIGTHNINVTYLNHLQIPTDIVTLTGDEIISRDLSLDRLSLKGNLQVRGLFDGINLTHLDQRFLDSFQNRFHNLTFLQPVNVSKITLNGFMNGLKLERLYSEVFFKTERTLYIPSKKIINNAFRCENIFADTVNGEILNDYLSLKDSNLIFPNLVKFSRPVKFSDIQVHGNVDGVKVYDLLQQAVTLDSPQTLVGSRNFTHGIRVLNQMKIHGSINGVHEPGNWLRYSLPQNITAPIKFKDVRAKTLFIDDQLDATSVNEQNFTEQVSNLILLSQNYSSTIGSTLNAILHCINCSTTNLETVNVNLKNFTHFLANYLSKTRPQIIRGQKYFVEGQYFRDIFTNRPNAVAGFDMRTLKYQAVTNEGYNIITKPVIIHGNLSLTRGQMYADKWNQINLNQFTKEIVRRNVNDTIRIQSDLIYHGDVDLMTDIRVHRINRLVPEETIMTNMGNYTIYSQVQFNEKLIASNDLHVMNRINSANLTELERDVLKKNERGELVLAEDGIINFVENFHTKEIIINGLVDNRTINRDSILMANGEQNIKKLTLDGQQWFNGSINVMSTINHHYDKDSLTKIVLRNSLEEQEIDYHKTFSKVIVKEIFHEKGLINVNVVNSVNLTEFDSNVIYPSKKNLNQPILVQMTPKFMENVTINNPHLKIFGEINGVHVADVVRLDRVRQTITGHKIFDHIVFNEDIEIRGLLNQVDVPKISKDMLLVYGNQYIRTPMVFIAPMHLKTNSSVKWFNNYRPEELATLNDPNRTLENYEFQFNKIEVQPGIKMPNKQLVNGVNLTDVYLNGFMNDYPMEILENEDIDDSELPEQIFDGSLIINEADFNQNISLTTHLNNLDLSETVNSIQQKFDPKIDSQKISQQLLDYKTLISTNRHYYEYANFEIDYFYSIPAETLKIPKPLETIYFEQRFKILNITSGSWFEVLFEKRRQNILWQTVKVQHWLFVAEIYVDTNLFRLIGLDQVTEKSWTILENTLEPGYRPFMFSMDQTLHILYYTVEAYENSCQNQGLSPTKLYRLEMDIGQLNHTKHSVQTFPQVQSAGNVGHYMDSISDYLVFNVLEDFGDRSRILVYQRSDPNCNFELFQIITNLPGAIRQISLFTFGLETLLEPYVAIRTDSHLEIFKQEGINGLQKKWSISLLVDYINVPRTRWQHTQVDYLMIPKNRNILVFPIKIHDYSAMRPRFLLHVGPLILDYCEDYANYSKPLFYEARFNQDFVHGAILHLIIHDYV